MNIRQGCRRTTRGQFPSTSHPFAVIVSTVELLGLGLPLHHRVCSLQVGGVGHQRQSDVAVGHTVDAPMVHPQVVLDISRTLRIEQEEFYFLW